jgi:hypothetical protein
VAPDSASLEYVTQRLLVRAEKGTFIVDEEYDAQGAYVEVAQKQGHTALADRRALAWIPTAGYRPNVS